nr:uncharacterized protein LOC109173926 [Ipomoea batatas]
MSRVILQNTSRFSDRSAVCSNQLVDDAPGPHVVATPVDLPAVVACVPQLRAPPYVLFSCPLLGRVRPKLLFFLLGVRTESVKYGALLERPNLGVDGTAKSERRGIEAAEDWRRTLTDGRGKKIVISDFTAKTGLIGKLKSCQLFTSVVTIDQFVKPVVYEFYANLAPELVCHNKVYIRGQLFDFGPDRINYYFWSADYDDEFVEDMDQITSKLTGGAKTRWVAKDTIKILDARNGANNKKKLILPNLIYGILVSQGFTKHDTEDYEAQSLPIKVDPRLLHGTHVNDLGAPEDSHHQTQSSSDGAIVDTIQILEEEQRFATLFGSYNDPIAPDTSGSSSVRPIIVITQIAMRARCLEEEAERSKLVCKQGQETSVSVS